MPFLAFLFGGALWMRIGLFLMGVVAPIVYRVLSALGVGFVVFFGVGQLLSGIEGYVKNLFGQMHSNILTILGIAQVDIAINILFAALSARLVIIMMDKTMSKPIRTMGWKSF